MTTAPARTSRKSNCGHTMQLDLWSRQRKCQMQQRKHQFLAAQLCSTAATQSPTAVIHLAVRLVVQAPGPELVSPGHKKRVVIHHPLTY
jgi:hypothetical protein